MKIFVLFHNVPYEFGEVLGVFSSKELAEAGMEKEFGEVRNRTIVNNRGKTVNCGHKPDPEEYEIQEWNLDGGRA